jgi:xanthine dehydrogenase molybdenum-binding subunit
MRSMSRRVRSSLDFLWLGQRHDHQGLRGQIIGGDAGAGFALSEVLAFDDEGRILNPNLTDYKVPRATDFPVWTKTLWEEDYDPVGPFGARSAGEAPIAAAPPAIAQAVHNAIGIWVDLPMTPERVLEALREQRRAEQQQPTRTPAGVPAR